MVRRRGSLRQHWFLTGLRLKTRKATFGSHLSLAKNQIPVYIYSYRAEALPSFPLRWGRGLGEVELLLSRWSTFSRQISSLKNRNGPERPHARWGRTWPAITWAEAPDWSLLIAAGSPR